MVQSSVVLEGCLAETPKEDSENPQTPLASISVRGQGPTVSGAVIEETGDLAGDPLQTSTIGRYRSIRRSILSRYQAALALHLPCTTLEWIVARAGETRRQKHTVQGKERKNCASQQDRRRQCRQERRRPPSINHLVPDQAHQVRSSFLPARPLGVGTDAPHLPFHSRRPLAARLHLHLRLRLRLQSSAAQPQLIGIWQPLAVGVAAEGVLLLLPSVWMQCNAHRMAQLALIQFNSFGVSVVRHASPPTHLAQSNLFVHAWLSQAPSCPPKVTLILLLVPSSSYCSQCLFLVSLPAAHGSGSGSWSTSTSYVLFSSLGPRSPGFSSH